MRLEPPRLPKMSRSLTRLEHLLLQSAARDAERELFIGPAASARYGEVARDAEAFAAGLQQLGLSGGDRVALALDNIQEYVVAYYGTLFAGGVVMPLCPDVRGDALLRPVRHAEARAIVVADRLVPQLAGAREHAPNLLHAITVGQSGVRHVAAGLPALVSFAEIVGSASPSASVRTTGTNELASLMYTSGTTSAPKGVMLSHRNLLANTASIVEYLRLRPDDRAALVLPLYYSYGISVLHTHMQVGGAIVAAGSVAFPAAVLQNIARHRCTGLPGVPSTFLRLVRSSVLPQADLSSLRYLTQAGGPMSAELTREVRRAIPHAALYVMYGQTEASPRLSYLPPEELERKLGSAGKAIPGVELEVVDERGEPAPPGTVGELVARGENIMLGYWKDDDATRRALGPRGLHTGDLARVDEEGFIYLVGRRTDQIKSGAHRISPEEIEEVVQAFEGVQECAAVGAPDELLGEAIVVFVVLRPGRELDVRAILRHCFERLPKFKQPARVELLSELPRTSNGKLRRSELRARLSTSGGT